MERTLCRLKLLCLTGTANATIESSERNDLLVFRDIAEVGICLWQFKAYGVGSGQYASSLTKPSLTRQSSSDLSHIFEVSAQILSPRTGG
jgi:hypothetical protein